MRKETKNAIRAARELYDSATTRSGNDEPTWLIPAEKLMELGDALEDLGFSPWQYDERPL